MAAVPTKKSLKLTQRVFPSPQTVVGVMANGKPNWAAIAWACMVGSVSFYCALCVYKWPWSCIWVDHWGAGSPCTGVVVCLGEAYFSFKVFLTHCRTTDTIRDIRLQLPTL